MEDALNLTLKFKKVILAQLNLLDLQVDGLLNNRLQILNDLFASSCIHDLVDMTTIVDDN